jgi:phage baseplate assembly protein W
MSGLNTSNDTQIGDLKHGYNQRTLSETPRRYTFRISCDPTIQGAVDTAIGGSRGFGPGVVDQVTLKINPQTYRFMEPTRQGVTQTVSGAWVDWYGLGLPKINLAGTTGWKPDRMKLATATSGFALLQAGITSRAQDLAKTVNILNKNDPNAPTGLQDFIYLRNRIFRTYATLLQKVNLKHDQKIQDQVQLQFFAWDTEDFCVVLIDQFELNRSIARPMLYDYNIQMTVIGYVGDRAGAWTDFLSKIDNPKAGLTGILGSIQAANAWMKGIQATVRNASLAVSEAIGSITAQIDAVSQGIEEFMSNATGMITVPLQFVTQLTTDIRNLGDSVLGIAQLPERFKNELHNQLVSTWCALSGLTAYPEMFQETFKSLADGAPWSNLNCSGTLGIPPNPTNTDPGVRAQESNTPPNGFSGIMGPTAPVALSQPSPATSPYRLSEATITEGDTIQSVITKLGGLDQNIAQVWQQIATLNNLEYPYIVPDVNFQTEVRATVTVVLSGTPGTIVSAGTRIGTLAITSNEDIIIFRTIVSATIGADGKATVIAMAEKPGEFANVKAMSVSQFIDAVGQPTTISGVNTIENPNTAAGGKIYKVLKPGQKLKIPVALDTARETGYVDRSATIDENLFKNDIALDSNGDIVADGRGDIQVVSGIDNMAVAIQDRLRTDKGELIKHPGYGFNTQQVIGEPGDQNFLDFAKLELQATLLEDPRIKSIKNMTLAKDTQALWVDMNLILIDEKSRPTNASIPL